VLAAGAQYNVLTFHGDRQLTGSISNEKILTPRNVSGGGFGPVWDSSSASYPIPGLVFPRAER
jgi:hypothetical protein